MLNFEFLEKDLGLISPPYILWVIFQEKYFSCYFLLPYQTNIKRYINQREFGSFNVNSSRANKYSV